MVDVLRSADRLATAAAADDGPEPVRLLAAVIDGTDELTAVAAVHALAQVFDDGADAVLTELLSHPRAFLREHASWALESRLPRLDAIDRLVGVVVGGGFSGVLAQRTLARWAASAPGQVALRRRRCPRRGGRSGGPQQAGRDPRPGAGPTPAGRCSSSPSTPASTRPCG